MTPKLQVLCTTIYPLLETPASLSHDIILQVCCYQFLKPLSFLLYLHYFFSILKSTFHCVYIYIYIYIYIHTHTQLTLEQCGFELHSFANMDCFSIVNITVLHDLRLVESMDMELWIQKVNCKLYVH